MTPQAGAGLSYRRIYLSLVSCFFFLRLFSLETKPKLMLCDQLKEANFWTLLPHHLHPILSNRFIHHRTRRNFDCTFHQSIDKHRPKWQPCIPNSANSPRSHPQPPNHPHQMPLWTIKTYSVPSKHRLPSYQSHSSHPTSLPHLRRISSIRIINIKTRRLHRRHLSDFHRVLVERCVFLFVDSLHM